jgi:hypothetical protein
LVFLRGNFFALGDARDEVEETVTVAFWWDGRDLGFRVAKTFPEVFDALD